MYLIYITCKDKKEAEAIAKRLLEEKLIGCANIIKEIDSMYWWKGKIEAENEALLLCKTNEEKVDAVIERVTQLHSYDVPAVEAIKIEKGNKDYEKWLKEVLE